MQVEFLRTIPGLEDLRMIRPGYAIEYDFAPPTQLKPCLLYTSCCLLMPIFAGRPCIRSSEFRGITD